MVFVLPNGSNGDECRWRRAHDLAPECREPGVTPSPPPGICLLSLRVLQHAAFNINLAERGCAVASACRVTCGGELLRPGHAGSHPNSQRKQNKKFPHCRPRGEVYQQPNCAVIAASIHHQWGCQQCSSSDAIVGGEGIGCWGTYPVTLKHIKFFYGFLGNMSRFRVFGVLASTASK